MYVVIPMSGQQCDKYLSLPGTRDEVITRLKREYPDGVVVQMDENVVAIGDELFCIKELAFVYYTDVHVNIPKILKIPSLVATE